MDTLVVPTLAARGALDDRSLDILADDHSYVDELLSDLGDALGVLSFGLGSERFWIGKASDLAGALVHVLAGQLEREERLLTPLVARCFSADERSVVATETLRAVATGPVRFSLAWLYAHVTDEERAAIVAARAGVEPPGVAHPAQRLRTIERRRPRLTPDPPARSHHGPSRYRWGPPSASGGPHLDTDHGRLITSPPVPRRYLGGRCRHAPCPNPSRSSCSPGSGCRWPASGGRRRPTRRSPRRPSSASRWS